MRRSNEVEIEASAADVWTVMVNVEEWPTWAPQMKRLDRVEQGPLRLGSRIRVRPKGLPANVWHVTEFEEGRLFSWETTLMPGFRLIGGHELTTRGSRTGAQFWLDA